MGASERSGVRERMNCRRKKNKERRPCRRGEGKGEGEVDSKENERRKDDGRGGEEYSRRLRKTEG